MGKEILIPFQKLQMEITITLMTNCVCIWTHPLWKSRMTFASLTHLETLSLSKLKMMLALVKLVLLLRMKFNNPQKTWKDTLPTCQRPRPTSLRLSLPAPCNMADASDALQVKPYLEIHALHAFTEALTTPLDPSSRPAS